MSRPAEQTDTRMPRRRWHIVVEREDRTEFISCHTSAEKAATESIPYRKDEKVKSVDIEERSWCTCPDR